MGAEGSCFGFGDLLQMLSDRRRTGRLTVHAPAVEGIVLYDRMTGRLREGAPSTEGIVFLDNGRLIGLIGPEGEVVVPSTADGDGARWPDAGVRFIESLLRAAHVAFAFEPGVTWRGGPPVSEESIHAAVEKRIRFGEWSRTEGVVPSLTVRPTLVSRTSGDVTLDRDDWRVLKSINGRRTVSGLGQATGLGVVVVCEQLMDLFRRGLVELNLPPLSGPVVEDTVDTSAPVTSSGHGPEDASRRWYRQLGRHR